ncbi:ABC transporter ATP-binding protein [bacterium]|nr:ABC transporter ATP-binding protein [bacterium]
MTKKTILSLNKIHKHYDIEGHRLDVLNGVDFLLHQGDKVALTGKSGAGKSTLMNIIATIEYPDEGSVEIDEQKPFLMSDHKLSLFRNRHIGVVFQFHHLLPEFNALENVMMPLLIAGKRGEAQQKAEIILERVGLADRMRHKPAELSGGEQQRIAIARAVVTAPSLLLLDEPTGNLDHETGKKIIGLIHSIAEEHRLTTIFVTHNQIYAGEMDITYSLEQGVVCRV